VKFPGAAETPRAKRSASAIERVRYRAQPGDSFIGLPGQTVDDYWAWAYGNLVGNMNRGILAEYIVGAALGALTPHREVWDAFDHQYREHGIEVKASAYLQAWEQSKLSTIRFGIAPHWPDNTDKATANERVRHADCYVFCLLTTTDPDAVNPLDLSQWEFYVMPTGAVPEGGTIGLSGLKSITSPVSWGGLRAAVDCALEQFAEGAP
jgi:hypothetical protein